MRCSWLAGGVLVFGLAALAVVSGPAPGANPCNGATPVRQGCADQNGGAVSACGGGGVLTEAQCVGNRYTYTPDDVPLTCTKTGNPTQKCAPAIFTSGTGGADPQTTRCGVRYFCVWNLSDPNYPNGVCRSSTTPDYPQTEYMAAWCPTPGVYPPGP